MSSKTLMDKAISELNCCKFDANCQVAFECRSSLYSCSAALLLRAVPEEEKQILSANAAASSKAEDCSFDNHNKSDCTDSSS